MFHDNNVESDLIFPLRRFPQSLPKMEILKLLKGEIYPIVQVLPTVKNWKINGLCATYDGNYHDYI